MRARFVDLRSTKSDVWLVVVKLAAGVTGARPQLAPEFEHAGREIGKDTGNTVSFQKLCTLQIVNRKDQRC